MAQRRADLVEWTLLVVLGAVALWLGSGCAPATPVKRSALTLAPSPPSSSGRSLPRGRVLIEGGMAPAQAAVEEDAVTLPGDAGLWIPTQQYSASLRAGIADTVELGFKGLWGRYEDAVMSTPGVAPLGDEREVWALGPTLTVSIPVGDSGFVFGLVGEAYWVTVPYASWYCEACDGQYLYDPEQAHYRMTDQGTETFLFFNTAFLGNFRLHDTPLEFYGGLGFHSTITNIGFDDQVTEDSTLEQGSILPMAIVGVDFEPGDLFRISLKGFFPFNDIGDSAHAFGPGLDVSFGLLL